MAELSFWDKVIKPDDIASQSRTGKPRKLIAGESAKTTVAYDPLSFGDITSLVNKTVTLWDRLYLCSPRGSVWIRRPGSWYLKSVEFLPPDITEGEQPETTITVELLPQL